MDILVKKLYFKNKDRRVKDIYAITSQLDYPGGLPIKKGTVTRVKFKEYEVLNNMANEKKSYDDLLKQAHKCDTIAYEAKVIKLIIECKDLSKKELEDKLSSLQNDWTAENEKFKQDKKDYEDMKEAEQKIKSRIIVPN